MRIGPEKIEQIEQIAVRPLGDVAAAPIEIEQAEAPVLADEARRLARRHRGAEQIPMRAAARKEIDVEFLFARIEQRRRIDEAKTARL